MNRFATPLNRVALIAAASISLLAAAAYAQDPQSAGPKAEAVPAVDTSRPAAPGAAAPAAPETETRAPAAPGATRPVSPMMAEMQAVLAAEAGKLADLRQRTREAATPDVALAVQREIERLKFETEISLLRVQAKHARAAGRIEVATRIESAVSELLNPSRPLAPAARPVPSRENSSR